METFQQKQPTDRFPVPEVLKSLIGSTFALFNKKQQLEGFNEKEKVSLFDSAFETIYKWQSKWISILVKPIFHTTALMHYIVRLQDGKIVFLKFEDEKWVEVGEGATSRATACGEAIDNYYLCNVLL